MDKLDFIKQMMQQNIGITDEDFKSYMSFPRNIKLAEATPEMMKYKIVAEVMEAQYCTAGLKKGQKYTFQALPAVFLPDKSTAPVCARGMAPLGAAIGEIWDELLEGKIKTHTVECLDPGVKKGGLGHVIFKLYAQKSE
jgi:hypothetical protein